METLLVTMETYVVAMVDVGGYYGNVGSFYGNTGFGIKLVGCGQCWRVTVAPKVDVGFRALGH